MANSVDPDQLLPSVAILRVTVRPKLSKHFGESQTVVCLDRCLLNTGKYLHLFFRDLKKWPLKTGDCLIQVAFKTGLTV